VAQKAPDHAHALRAVLALTFHEDLNSRNVGRPQLTIMT
jgi:hypothetical protein